MLAFNDVGFPEAFDPASSILFLGSGFSAEATNSAMENPPVGKGLQKKLLKLLNEPDDSDYDLKDLATHAIKRDVDLHALLTNQFTITALTDDQRIVLAQKWRRIYTTNYDDAVEWYRKNSTVAPRQESFSYDDPLPAKILPGTVVHLHGYIHKCTRENVIKQLILGHYSYAEQFVKNSPWWDQFERDLRTAEGIYFIGYSLNDFAVASYLTKSPSFVEKSHFILRPDPDPVMRSRIADYGSLQPIAVKGFAEKCKTSIDRAALSHPHTLRAFVYFDPHKDNKAPTKPSSVEIDALMTLGNFKLQRLLSTFPEPSYVIPRTAALDQAVTSLIQSRTLIIHSKIGNGKSIFRNCLLMQLSRMGHTCFRCRDDVTIPEQDIEFIKAQAKPVIIFTNYDTAYTTIGLLNGLPETTRFIVEMNTSMLQVRRNEAHSRLCSPIERLNLNRLTKRDVEALRDLLDRAGIARPDTNSQFSDGAEMRDIVLSLYGNQKVAQRINDLVAPMLADGDFRRVIYCSVLLKSVDLSINPAFLRKITGVDSYDVLSKFREGALEIMNFDLDRIEPHSSLFSEYLIHNLLDGRELIDWIYKICAEAARRAHEDGNPQSSRLREARHILGMLLTYSYLRGLFIRKAERDDLIGELYELGRSNIYINDEPLFWLQYSIFMQNLGEWGLAEKHMQTAYDRAEHRPNFKTFQLDTNSFGLLLDLERQDLGSVTVSRFEEISERLDKLREMLGDGNHRGHALSVLTKLEDFTRARRNALSTSEAARLVYHLHLLINTLELYDAGLKAETGSEGTVASLQRSLNAILRPA